jgi:hypothetical protein
VVVLGREVEREPTQVKLGDQAAALVIPILLGVRVLLGKVLLEVNPLRRGSVFHMEVAAAVHQRLAQTAKERLAIGQEPVLSREVLGVQV